MQKNCHPIIEWQWMERRLQGDFHAYPMLKRFPVNHLCGNDIKHGGAYGFEDGNLIIPFPALNPAQQHLAQFTLEIPAADQTLLQGNQNIARFR